MVQYSVRFNHFRRPRCANGNKGCDAFSAPNPRSKQYTVGNRSPLRNSTAKIWARRNFPTWTNRKQAKARQPLSWRGVATSRIQLLSAAASPSVLSLIYPTSRSECCNASIRNSFAWKPTRWLLGALGVRPEQRHSAAEDKCRLPP